MKYRMHVKGRGIIEGTMAEGPAPGLVHIVGAETLTQHQWHFGSARLPADWPSEEVELGRWDLRRLLGETVKAVPVPSRDVSFRVDVIVPACDIKWAKEIK